MKIIIYLFTSLCFLTSCSNDDKDVFDYVNFFGESENGVELLLKFRPDNTCEELLYVSATPPGYLTFSYTYHKNGNNIWIYSYGNTLLEGTGTLEGNTLTYRSGTSVYILERLN